MPAAVVTAAVAFLGVISFDVSLMFGLTITPLSVCLSCALIAFVVLRHQEQAAVSMMLIAGIVVLVAAVVTGAVVVEVLVFVVLCWLGTLVLATILRRTGALNLAVLAVVPFTLFIAMVVWSQRSGLIHFWRDALLSSIGEISEAEKAQLGAENVEKLFETMPMMMAESAANWAILVILGSIFIARHWQASLFNAGGFQREFHALKLGKQAAVFCAVVVLLSWLIPSFGGSADEIGSSSEGVAFPVKLLLALASAMLFVFLIQGLSVLHCLAKQRGMNRGWLVGIYVLMPLPLTMLLVGALGIADNFVRIRKVQ